MLDRTDLGTKRTGYTSFCINILRLLGYLDTKISDLPTNLLNCGIGHELIFSMAYGFFDFLGDYTDRAVGADIRCFTAKRGSVSSDLCLLFY